MMDKSVFRIMPVFESQDLKKAYIADGKCYFIGKTGDLENALKISDMFKYYQFETTIEEPQSMGFNSDYVGYKIKIAADPRNQGFMNLLVKNISTKDVVSMELIANTLSQYTRD